MTEELLAGIDIITKSRDEWMRLAKTFDMQRMRQSAVLKITLETILELPKEQSTTAAVKDLLKTLEDTINSNIYTQPVDHLFLSIHHQCEHLKSLQDQYSQIEKSVLDHKFDYHSLPENLKKSLDSLPYYGVSLRIYTTLKTATQMLSDKNIPEHEVASFLTSHINRVEDTIRSKVNPIINELLEHKKLIEGSK